MILNDFIKPKRPGRRVRRNTAFPVFSDADKDLYEVVWYMKENGYAARTANYFDKESGKWKNKTATAHRVVMERIVGRSLTKNDIVDHFNRNKMDCRRENLSIVTSAMNAQNRRAYKNKSGHKGVVFYRDKGKNGAWVGRVKVLGKWKVTKCYRDAGDANKAVIELRKKLKIHDYDLVGM